MVQRRISLPRGLLPTLLHTLTSLRAPEHQTYTPTDTKYLLHADAVSTTSAQVVACAQHNVMDLWILAIPVVNKGRSGQYRSLSSPACVARWAA